MFFVILTALLWPGVLLAQATDCGALEESVDPTTGERSIITKWRSLTSVGALPKGSIRGISRGDQTFLGVHLTAATYYPIPADLDISPDDADQITHRGVFDARLNPFIKELQEDSFFVPAGSTLRITMEDRTTVTVKTVEDIKIRSRVDRPRWNNNKTPHLRVRITAELEYFVSADALATLRAKTAINMRLETQDQYYSFGRNNRFFGENFWTPKTNFTLKQFAWAPKVYPAIQTVMNCVL